MRATALATFGASAIACDGGSAGPAAVPEPTHGGPGVRIVSLSPGITATVCALGARGALVGRTPWCVGVDEVPVVGTLLDFHAERMIEARPTAILVQPPAQGVSEPLMRLADEKAWTVYRHELESIDDVRALLASLPSELAPDARDPRSASLRSESARLRGELDGALAPLSGASALGRTLVLVASGESPEAMAFGSGTYLAQALRAMGVTLALERGGYPALSLEAIASVAPDTIILIGKGGAMLATRLAPLVPQARCVRLDGAGLLQPGAAMIGELNQLRALLAEYAQ